MFLIDVAQSIIIIFMIWKWPRQKPHIEHIELEASMLKNTIFEDE